MEERRAGYSWRGESLWKKGTVIDEISRGTNFYTVELVNATGDDLAPQTPMSIVYKMIVTMMLQNGFEPCLILGRDKGLLSLFQSSLRDPKMVWGTTPQMVT